MNTNKIATIFKFLSLKGIKPIHSVPFCLRLSGKQISEVAKACKVTRSMFYKVLAGERKSNERIKRELLALGIDPWKDVIINE